MLTTLHKIFLGLKNKLRSLLGKNQTFSKPGHHQGDDDLVSKSLLSIFLNILAMQIAQCHEMNSCFFQ